MADNVHKVLAQYEKAQAQLGFRVQVQTAKLEHLANERDRKKDIGEERKKDCVITQQEVDRFEEDVNTTVMSCMELSDEKTSMVRAIKQTAVDCAHASGVLNSMDVNIARDRVTLEEIKDKLSNSNTVTVNPAVADQAVDEVRKIMMNLSTSPNITTPALSKDIAISLREREKAIVAGEADLKAKEAELMAAKVAFEVERKAEEADRQKRMSALKELVHSLEMEQARCAEGQQTGKMKAETLDGGRMRMQTSLQEASLQLTDITNQKEALQSGMIELESAMKEHCKELAKKEVELATHHEQCQALQTSCDKTAVGLAEVAELEGKIEATNLTGSHLNEKIMLYHTFASKKVDSEEHNRTMVQSRMQLDASSTSLAHSMNDAKLKSAHLNREKLVCGELVRDARDMERTAQNELDSMHEEVLRYEGGNQNERATIKELEHESRYLKSANMARWTQKGLEKRVKEGVARSHPTVPIVHNPAPVIEESIRNTELSVSDKGRFDSGISIGATDMQTLGRIDSVDLNNVSSIYNESVSPSSDTMKDFWMGGRPVLARAGSKATKANSVIKSGGGLHPPQCTSQSRPSQFDLTDVTVCSSAFQPAIVSTPMPEKLPPPPLVQPARKAVEKPAKVPRRAKSGDENKKTAKRAKKTIAKAPVKRKKDVYDLDSDD